MVIGFSDRVRGGVGLPCLVEGEVKSPCQRGGTGGGAIQSLFWPTPLPQGWSVRLIGWLQVNRKNTKFRVFLKVLSQHFDSSVCPHEIFRQRFADSIWKTILLINLIQIHSGFLQSIAFLKASQLRKYCKRKSVMCSSKTWFKLISSHAIHHIDLPCSPVHKTINWSEKIKVFHDMHSWQICQI